MLHNLARGVTIYNASQNGLTPVDESGQKSMGERIFREITGTYLTNMLGRGVEEQMKKDPYTLYEFAQAASEGQDGIKKFLQRKQVPGVVLTPGITGEDGNDKQVDNTFFGLLSMMPPKVQQSISTRSYAINALNQRSIGYRIADDKMKALIEIGIVKLVSATDKTYVFMYSDIDIRKGALDGRIPSGGTATFRNNPMELFYSPSDIGFSQGARAGGANIGDQENKFLKGDRIQLDTYGGNFTYDAAGSPVRYYHNLTRQTIFEKLKNPGTKEASIGYYSGQVGEGGPPMFSGKGRSSGGGRKGKRRKGMKKGGRPKKG